MKQKHHVKDNENISKSMVGLNKIQRKVEVEKVQVQCACKHSRMNLMALHPIPNGNGSDYRCSLCTKTVNIKTIPEEQFRTAYATLDRICDHLKIQCQDASKADKEAAKELAQIQFGLYRLLMYYDASKQQSNRNKKNNNRDKERTRSRNRYE